VIAPTWSHTKPNPQVRGSSYAKMDASAASTALAAVASTAVVEGVALFVAVGDPCPSYADQ
jgi:hypothetical protein